MLKDIYRDIRKLAEPKTQYRSLRNDQLIQKIEEIHQKISKWRRDHN